MKKKIYKSSTPKREKYLFDGWTYISVLTHHGTWSKFGVNTFILNDRVNIFGNYRGYRSVRLYHRIGPEKWSRYVEK